MLRVAAVKRRVGFALGVEFEAPTPGIVALFGRSGCGKTTTIEIIAGLLDPDEGHVQLDETVLLDTRRKHSVPAERRRMGYVFQDARLFPHLKIAGNLRYGEKRAPRGSHEIRFEQIVALLGLESLLQRRPYQLSGGERQRVALGRALLSQPRLLLLDEPLAALDAARRDEVLPYLEALRDQLSIPIVYVSHQFDEVLRLANHVVLLDAGSVVAQGPPGQISLQPELRAIVGPEAVGAVLEGVVSRIDGGQGLAQIKVGQGTLRVSAHGVAAGDRVRVQLLARDLILATEPPRGLSVRNSIQGMVREVRDDTEDASLVTVDIGGPVVLARVTRDAVAELELTSGTAVWVLVKAVSMRSHVYPARAESHTPRSPS